MANSANHNNAFLDVEQDAIVTHAQAVSDFRLAQPLNVTMETVPQPLPEDEPPKAAEEAAKPAAPAAGSELLTH